MRLIMLSELRFFINSILWGVILLVLYDIIRIFRRVVTHKNFFIMLEDIVYWLINSILIFRMMYQYNNGTIRAFTILGILIGMVLYHGSLSDMIVDYISSVINAVIDIICKIINTIVTIVLWPFRFVFSFLNKILVFLYKKIGGFVIKSIRKLASPPIKALKNTRKRVRIKLSKDNQENES